VKALAHFGVEQHSRLITHDATLANL